MATTTAIKDLLNRALAPIGLKLDTLTAERRELRRLSALEEGGYFDAPCFPLPAALRDMDPEPALRVVERFASRFEDFASESKNPVGYSFDNDFFSSPDAEVLYSMIRMTEPRVIVEVGCGHSTRLARLAVMDGELAARIVGIDPSPRREIESFADEVMACPVESLTDLSLFTNLEQGDVLSIDSSHELKAGNDLLFLYFSVLPRLRPGVIVHIHDVFLPYDYKSEWVIGERRAYSEQYLVQAMLQAGDRYEVLWAGHYIQKTMEGFNDYFPQVGDRSAQSLWLKKVA